MSTSVEMELVQVGRGIRPGSDGVYFFAKGGTNRVLVDADGFCSISVKSGDWFTVTPGNNNSFTVKADAYDGEAERTGSIAIELKDLSSGSCQVILPVVQMKSAAYTHGAYQEDRDLNLLKGGTFSIHVTGYSSDRNWKGSQNATIGGEGYGNDENWN